MRIEKPANLIVIQAPTRMHFIANRRCAQLGLAPVFDFEDNPSPWTRVVEYQNGGALALGMIVKSRETQRLTIVRCARLSKPSRHGLADGRARYQQSVCAILRRRAGQDKTFEEVCN
jgi:hypothetical protein